MDICVYVVLQMHLIVQDKDSTNKTVSEAGVLRRDDANSNLATTSLLDGPGIMNT